jgi:RNA polymerase sigma factor (sigma-70 family)
MTLQIFEEEVLPLKNKLFRFAFSILNDHHRAKDVVQETLLKVWEKRDKLDEIRNVEAWCMTIVRNMARDGLKAKNSQILDLNQHLPSVANNDWPDKAAQYDELLVLLGKIVKQLPSKQKETFHMREIEGYSYQEISEISGYSISDIKVSIFRARKQIRAQLKRLENYEFTKSRGAAC